MNLRISTRRSGSVAILDLSGAVTLGDNSQSLRDQVKALLAQGDLRILLNFQDVAYVDSSGLAALVSSVAAATRAGGSIKLLHLQKRVAELIRLTRLSSLLESFEDENEALASF